MLRMALNKSGTSSDNLFPSPPIKRDKKNAQQICNQLGIVPSASEDSFFDTIPQPDPELCSSSEEDFDYDDDILDRDYDPSNDIEYLSDHEISFPNIAPAEVMHDIAVHDTAQISPADEVLPDIADNETTDKKGYKRKKDPTKWKKNVVKKLRNSGQITNSNNQSARSMKEGCGPKCILKCSSTIPEDRRLELFQQYWNLGCVEGQWSYIANNIKEVVPKLKFRRIRTEDKGEPRKPNQSFSLNYNDCDVKVCKVFFCNTLGISQRTVRTVIAKKNKLCDVLLEEDKRGKHNNHKTMDVEIKARICAHIDSIPRIESHYLRQQTTREYIDGSRSISDIYKDYVEKSKEESVDYCSYATFHKIFRDNYNISFFEPKKDQCETCVTYSNSTEEEKALKTEEYETHLKEKNLSRIEKEKDKANANIITAVYDLQAVMQLPKGNISTFYYTSKLNVLNFTIFNLKSKDVSCFVWDESDGKRGVNEIGSCVLKWLENIANLNPGADVVFWSDNCAGQQKNKFMCALYIYAVNNLNLGSITHKFLIKGHTQNEGDSAHSLIEKNVKRILKGGPIYTREGFVTAIKGAKKSGKPYQVFEQSFDDFYNIKNIFIDLNLNLGAIKMSDIKMLKFTKENPGIIFYKSSFEDEIHQAKVLKKMPKISICKAYTQKIGLSDKKKSDLLGLINKKAIPSCYQQYYENL